MTSVFVASKESFCISWKVNVRSSCDLEVLFVS